jgi:hypothetical protein
MRWPANLLRNSIPCRRCGSVNTCSTHGGEGARCAYEGWSWDAIKAAAPQACDEKRARILAAAARFRLCFEAGHDPLACRGHEETGA